MSNSVGEMIRSWRGQRGFSQMQLALECDTSSRHLSCVETGRAQASKALLLQLFEILDMPLRLRNHLLVASGFSIFYPETGLSEPEMQQANWMLEKILHSHLPYPAMLLDRNFNILQCNSSFGYLARTFVSDAKILEQKPWNMLRLLFQPGGWAEQLENLAEVFSVNMSRATRSLALDPGNKELQALIDEVAELRPEDFARWRREQSVQMPQLILSVRYRNTEHAVSLHTTVATLGAPQNVYLQELQIESGYPSDPGSEQFFLEAEQRDFIC